VNADHNYHWWDAIHQKIAIQPNTRCPYNIQEPCDDQGHGTHTVGTGVGDDGAGNQVGMAPGAKWMACRNMDQGVGQPSAYIECLQFFIAPWALADTSHSNPNPALHADVISNSYSCTASEGCTAPGVLHQAVENVRAAGIFMAVSAGNEGPGCSTLTNPPATENNVFTVGAVDQAGHIAGFSSRGPVIQNGTSRVEPDLAAPGVLVRSSTIGGGYGISSGTSMAAPHVAGAVALLWHAYPRLRGNVAQTEALLQTSASPVLPTDPTLCGSDTPTSVPNNVYGSGLLNVLAAYNAFPQLRYTYFPWMGR
jgi:subtilisin family serine protease